MRFLLLRNLLSKIHNFFLLQPFPKRNSTSQAFNGDYSDQESPAEKYSACVGRLRDQCKCKHYFPNLKIRTHRLTNTFLYICKCKYIKSYQVLYINHAN